MIARTKPPNRRRKGGARRGPWRSDKYRLFISSFPCIICGHPETQAAHTGNDGGMSMKASDHSCVPACIHGHHDEIDGRRALPTGLGKRAFEQWYGVNLKEIALGFYQAWLLRGGKVAA